MIKIFFFVFITAFCVISEKIQGQKNFIKTSGDILSVGMPVATFASTQIWRDDEKAGWQFAGAISTSMLITHSVKWIIDKPRPNGGSFSFPSGHTSSAFTAAAFVQRRYGWKTGIPLYIVASYAGWTRIHENRHDYWDVLGGAVIGIGSAYLFAQPYNNAEQENWEIMGSTLLALGIVHLFAWHATKHKIDLSCSFSGNYRVLNLNYIF